MLPFYAVVEQRHPMNARTDEQTEMEPELIMEHFYSYRQIEETFAWSRAKPSRRPPPLYATYLWMAQIEIVTECGIALVALPFFILFMA